MIHIYERPSDNNQDLPEEDIWLKEDHVVSSMQAGIEWNAKHGRPNEYAPENNRNFQFYMCDPLNGPPYERVTFERRYAYRYHEAKSIEDFLKNLNDYWKAVTYSDGYFFLVSTSDL